MVALCYYKLGKKLWQTAAGNLLQSGAVTTTKYASYYKLGLLYYKVR